MRRKIFLVVGIVFAIGALAMLLSRVSSVKYSVGGAAVSDEEQAENVVLSEEGVEFPEALHLPTPEPLKALYMTSWVAGTPSIREDILALINETEVNAIVIDIKDDTGRISYEVRDPELREVGSWENRIPDIAELIERLHESGVYVMGRVSVFQDPYFTSYRPDLAVKRASDGAVWEDYKGLSFIDVSAEEYWEYVVAVARDAYSVGFDEINFDYVRFPSDGNMKDVAYPHSGTTPREDALASFFAYLYEELADSEMVISADLFGYTTTNTDDLGIGQLLERALPYFDYIMPMVYPSHYNPGFIGFDNPAAHPYDVVHYSMESAVRRAETLALAKDSTATSTEVVRLRELANSGHGSVSPDQLRPWLQDFDLGATYTAEMVRGQMQATYDAGLTSWALWDAGNTYTESALESE